MADDQQIQGLPPGAELRPIQGLPPGAELRPMGGQGQDTPSPAKQPFGGVSHNLEHQEYQPIHSLRDIGENAVKAASNFGAGVLQAPYSIGHALLDPVQSGKELLSQYKDPANLLIGGSMARDIAQGRGAEAAGNLVGGAALGEIGGSAGRLVNPYRSPVVPTAETNAESLMKAILPQEGLTPNNVKAAMREAPQIRGYAGRTGNPLRTIPEGMKAAQGVADEGLQHYRSQFLEPNANEQVTLENGVSPELGHSATIGQLEKRISDINDMTRGALRTAKSSGAEMTAMERQGLEREGQMLRQKLYGGLSEKTGVSPEDIQGLREGYGGQYAIKNALESGHYGRLTRTGAASQGEGAGIYPSKAGLIEKTITTLRGGPEAIANRQFRKSIGLFEPQETNYPKPIPPPGKPFDMPEISPEVARRISTSGSPGGVQPIPPPSAKPTQGPMAKAPAVVEAEKTSKLLQDEKNADFRARRAKQPPWWTGQTRGEQ